MSQPGKGSSKHDYDKNRLKKKIDVALEDFLKSGRNVEHIPTVKIAPEALSYPPLAEPIVPPRKKA